MPNLLFRTLFLLLSIQLAAPHLHARTERLRCMWRSDPSTTMVIGWDQVSGTNPMVFYGTVNGGRNISKYPNMKSVDRVVVAKGQNNYFARLTELAPNTLYYFIIRDSEGSSRTYSFRTAPDSPDQPISIIAGGDSRNFREARCRANRMVAKLRPHFVLFAGDMTGGDTDKEWIEWMNDWQLTITKEGRLTPIIAARGNHEYSNQTLTHLFDLPDKNNYYALSFGGQLLRVITLNSNISSGGNQRSWLESELSEHRNKFWKIVQYHHPIRPHTFGKMDNDHLYADWAPLFFKYGVNLAVECDAHVVKATWPIRPSWEAGSDEGFIRDDLRGTVYVGEGGWGAPLRPANDEKSWTRAAGSFNHLIWIFVDKLQVQLRILPTDQESLVAPLEEGAFFQIPEGLKVWNTANGKVTTLLRRPNTPVLAGVPNGSSLSAGLNAPVETSNMTLSGLEASPYGNGIRLQWVTENEVDGTSYTIQRRLKGEVSFSTIHSFSGQAGKANIHQYIDYSLQAVPQNNWVEYRINGMLPNGMIKMYTVRSKRTGNAGMRPSLPRLQFVPGTRKITIPIVLANESEVATVFVNEEQKEVLRIFFRDLGPGKHQKQIDLTNLPRGSYQVWVEARARKLASYLLENP